MLIWKPVPGFPNYEVSNAGDVRSIRGARRGNRYMAGRVLRPNLKINGYVFVVMYVSGRRTQYLIHRLVMLAFIGPCPEGLQVNHKNGVKSDNRLENLEYVTPSENTLHCIHTLKRRTPQGETHYASRLSSEQVLAIRAATGKQKDIAAQFGISPNHVSSIKRKVKWTNI